MRMAAVTALGISPVIKFYTAVAAHGDATTAVLHKVTVGIPPDAAALVTAKAPGFLLWDLFQRLAALRTLVGWHLFSGLLASPTEGLDCILRQANCLSNLSVILPLSPQTQNFPLLYIGHGSPPLSFII
ncbi:MAG: hypothetical protein FWH26_05465 [Oscillospiraceae bacterium]|nr:hypothetical protein [Oscillospiraceae bacterium]